MLYDELKLRGRLALRCDKDGLLSMLRKIGDENFLIFIIISGFIFCYVQARIQGRDDEGYPPKMSKKYEKVLLPCTQHPQPIVG